MAESKVKIKIGSEADVRGFGKITGALKNTGARIKSFAVSVGSNLMNIKAGFDMLKGAVQGIGGMFKKSLDAETMTSQFSFLFDSVEKAKEHMAMLQEMGDTPPFSLEEFANASRQMLIISDGALGMKNSLEMVGDVAAGTGKSVEEVGEAVARAYTFIRDGEPVNRAVNALRNMGIITPEVAANLADLQQTGADNVYIWEQLENALGRYKGAMEKTEETGNGLIGAIKSRWDDALREFGEAFLDFGKKYLVDFLGWLKKIKEDGSIQIFAEKAVESLKGVSVAFATVANGIRTVKNFIQDTATAIGYGAVSLINGDSDDEVLTAMKEGWNERRNQDEVDKEEFSDKKKAVAEQKKVEEEKRKAVEEINEKARIREELARKQEEAEYKRQMEDQAEYSRKLEEQERADNEKYKKEQEKKRNEQLKKEAEGEIKAAKTSHQKRLEEIEAEKKAIEDYVEAFDRTAQNGITAEAQKSKGKLYTYTTNENGVVTNVAQWQRQQRFAKHGTLEQQREERDRARDERRMARINEKARQGFMLSKSEQRFVKGFQELNMRRQAEQQLKALEEKRRQAVINIEKVVEGIRKDLQDNLKTK